MTRSRSKEWIFLKLPDDLHAELVSASKVSGVPMSRIVSAALQDFLNVYDPGVWVALHLLDLRRKAAERSDQ